MVGGFLREAQPHSLVGVVLRTKVVITNTRWPNQAGYQWSRRRVQSLQTRDNAPESEIAVAARVWS